MPTSISIVTEPRAIAAVIGGGMFGGIAYWLIAGRWAGSWRQARYFACAVRIFSAKAENTPANR